MIPARIGSQRVKKKNLRLLHKRPLIDYILEAASKVEIFDHIYLNSDDEIEPFEKFIELCILLQCDYCPTIKGLGPANALQLLKKHYN